MRPRIARLRLPKPLKTWEHAIAHFGDKEVTRDEYSFHLKEYVQIVRIENPLHEFFEAVLSIWPLWVPILIGAFLILLAIRASYSAVITDDVNHVTYNLCGDDANSVKSQDQGTLKNDSDVKFSFNQSGKSHDFRYDDYTYTHEDIPYIQYLFRKIPPCPYPNHDHPIPIK